MAILPGFSLLRVLINPHGDIGREGMSMTFMPWLYAPWPEAKSKGIAEISVEGDTLRALLIELSGRYKQADIDFEPIEPGTSDVQSDYEVLVNGMDYTALPDGLDARLTSGDEVVINMVWYPD